MRAITIAFVAMAACRTDPMEPPIEQPMERPRPPVDDPLADVHPPPAWRFEWPVEVRPLRVRKVRSAPVRTHERFPSPPVAATDDKSVVAALDWLARHQNDDGSWNAAEVDYHSGVTALAVLAFVRAGHVHDAAARRGLRWLIGRQDTDGCVPERGPKYMYAHLIAAAALAEACGGSTIVRTSAERALHFTLAAQNPRKGWRYMSQCGDNDSSVTGWAVLSLRSAEAAGLEVPRAAYNGAIAWLEEVTDEGNFVTGYVAKRYSCHKINPHNRFDAHNTTTAAAIYARRELRRDDSRAEGGFP